MKTPLSLALLLTLAGCGLGSPRPPVTWYVLEDRPAAVASAATAWPGPLLVRETETSDFYQSKALVFSRAAGTRNHYQYARQPEPPAAQLALLIRQRLEKSGLFPVVSMPGSGVESRYQLNTRLLDLYHDAAQAPGVVRLVLEAELVKLDEGRQLAVTRIETSAPTASHDAAGAAAASNQAVGQALDQLVEWLGKKR